jgi:hypothetical protein
MPNIDQYLADLDSAATLGTSAAFVGVDASAFPGSDSSFNYGAPVDDIAGIFKFFTDANNHDNTDEGVSLMTTQGSHFLGDTSSTSSSSSVSNLYTAVASTSPVYTANVISDSSTAKGDTTDAAAQLDFNQELSRAIFGSRDLVDMITNDTAMTTSWTTAVEECATNISANFSTAGTAALLDAIGSSENAVKLVVCKAIYLQLKHTDVGRFDLSHNSLATGNPVDGSAIALTTDGSGTGATVNLFMTGTTVDSIQIVATGSGYAKGDSFNVMTSAGNYVTVAAISDLQASILNGTLSSTSGTELPLEVGDMFSIMLDISCADAQTNVEGKTLSTIGATVTRQVKLAIKLI